MCLPNFIEFKQIEKEDAVIGYRNWRNFIRGDNPLLISKYQDYIWRVIEGPHEVLELNSGIYSYNYNNYYYNNYNNYNNNYNNNNYNLSGIIKQYGKVAIHQIGYRSEFALIDTLFSIREVDAKGPKEFLEWIRIFNNKMKRIAKEYECKVISYQDFLESNNDK